MTTHKVPGSAATAASIPKIVLWSLILAYVLFFSAYSLQRHATFNTFAADLSYIDQPMWNTLHGHFLERTLDDRQVSRVAEHLEPIIIPIALVYGVWDDVRAILIIQTLALALGALPVYWIAREQLAGLAAGRLGLKPAWMALVFVLAYLMFPALQAANVADFHADPFVVAPLLFAFWYASQRRYRAMWAWAVVAMLVKETLPTLTLMLGGYLFLSRETGNRVPGLAESGFMPAWLTRRRLHGLALMALSLAWFYVATFLIVAPLARQVYGTEGPIYLSSRYAWAGGGLSGFLSQAVGTLALLGEPGRVRYLAGLFASVGWLALLAPEYLLLGLPVLLANTFSNFAGQYSGEQHYSAPLAPVFVIAAVYGFRRLVMGASQFPGATHFPKCVAPKIRHRPQRTDLTRLAGGRGARPARLTSYSLLAMAWLLAWSLGYQSVRGWTPLARDFEWPQITPHQRLLARFADQIPSNASLSTTPPLHPHLAHRRKIYVFPTVADADYVLLDVSGRTDAHPNDVRATFDRLVESGQFGVLDAADGYILLRRGYAGANSQSLPEGFYDFARVAEAQPQVPVRIEFGGQVRLLGYDVVDDPKWRQTYLRFYWQALSPLPDDLRLWPFVFSDAGTLIEDTSQRPMVAPLWYPPSRWGADETVVTQMLPWDLGERFYVGVAVLDQVAGRDPAAAFADPAARLPVTAAGAGAQLFHAESWAEIGGFARAGRRLAPVSDRPALSPQAASFAEGIRLTGYRISTPEAGGLADEDRQIDVMLQWQPDAAVTRDYTVFVHLVDADGQVVSQSDAQPGWVVPWPTHRWLPGQPILDSHQLLIPPQLPPGRYQVRVGLYYWETLERLPLLDQAMQPIADYLELGQVQLER
jgi:uncharacterized membrane protein